MSGVAGGLLLAGIGVLLLTQVFRGHLLERTGVVS